MTLTENTWWTHWREVDGTIVLHVDLAPDAEREARAVSLLDDSEKARGLRFRSVCARREFVLCRAALRVSLAERLGCSGERLSFGFLEHGKPYARLADRSVDIAFNVSHSGGHGLIAITDKASVGVDVEERAPQRDLDGIGSLVYGPRERRFLGNASDREKVQIFYRLWSMKEALIKALGTGFSLNPSGFEVPGPMLRGRTVRHLPLPAPAVTGVAGPGPGGVPFRRRACLPAVVMTRIDTGDEPPDSESRC